MPRSNKKKKTTHLPSSAQPFLEPPPKSLFPHPEHNSTPDQDISNLLTKEKTLMIARCIQSAQKHGINLKHGSSNPGTGDCSFEAIIQNINDRADFRQNFPMSINWYRRTWTTDMANRTIYSDYNTLTNKEWLEGWNQMLAPGAYERGIFGDLMIPGIACGLRKFILIFNTNPDTPHDPIYVVDPSNFNVMADSEIPVVLAYNMSHYESMEPCSDADVNATIDLARAYKDGRYRFTRQDIPRLISLQTVNVNVTSRAQKIEVVDGQDDPHNNISV